VPIGTPALIGTVQILPASGQTSVPYSVGTSIQAGDLVVVAVYWDAAGDPTGVADDHSNTFTKADSANRTGNSDTSLWYFYYTSAPGTTTITVSGASTQPTITGAWRISGITSSSPLDRIGGGDNGLSTTPSTTATGATAQADEIVMVAMGWNSISTVLTWPPTTGYTTLGVHTEDVRERQMAVAYKILSATETSSAASSFAGAEAWAFPLATFKGVAGIVKAGSAVIGP